MRERVKVRRRRRTRKDPSNALDAERWRTGAQSRRLRMFTLGSGVMLLLAITVFFIFRR